MMAESMDAPVTLRTPFDSLSGRTRRHPDEVVPHTGDFEMTVHWDGYNENLKSYGEGIRVDDDFYGKYHEIWYLWDENGYRLYLDGTDEKSLVFSIEGKKHGDGTCAVPCYLIISAEYGTWGGEIDETQLEVERYQQEINERSQKKKFSINIKSF